MKKTITCFILFYFILGIGNIKSQCLDTIAICQNGFSLIPFDYFDDSIKVSFNTSVGTSSGELPVEVRDSLIMVNAGFNYRSNGIYNIIVDSIIVCSGIYITNQCLDQVDFSNTQSCGSYTQESCHPNSSSTNTYFQFNYCLGDTTTFNIIAFDSLLSFSPDRLDIPLTELIEYTKTSFTVVWSDIGTSCLRYKTPTVFGDTTYAYYNIAVRPTVAPSILVDGLPNDTIHICESDSLHLSIEGVENEINIWRITSGVVSYSEKLNTAFDEAGKYDITAWTYNQCSCTPQSSLVVFVTKSEYPEINCVRTICLGETVTYTSPTLCDAFDWDISGGGIIVEGGSVSDNFVSVMWSSGTEGSVSLGTPTCIDADCARPKITPVSIINPNGAIEGISDICSDVRSTYTAPYYTGTTYEWVVSGNGVIQSGQGSNKVSVVWNSDIEKVELISVIYENCNIDCQGYAEKEVVVRPILEMVYESSTLCVDREFLFTNNLNIPVKWLIRDSKDSIIHEYSGQELKYTFDNDGIIIVDIINSDSTTCNVNIRKQFNVLSALHAPTSIYGSKFVCLNVPIQYSTNTFTNEIAEWNIYDGDTINPVITSIANDIVYSWTSNGPYKIELKKINTVTGCESPYFVQPISSQNYIIGPKDACISSRSYFRLAESPSESLVWKIFPTNAGKIKGPTSGSYIYVDWSKSGIHTISTTYCGKEIKIQVNVIAAPNVNFVFDNLVCYGDFSEVKVTTKANEIFEIRGTNNFSSSTTPTFVPKGNYYIVVKNEGCSKGESFKVIENPEFDIKIKVISPALLCNPTGLTQILIDKIKSKNSNSAVQVVKYEWFKDSIGIGENKPLLTISNFGSYFLKITDIYGCTGVSNVLFVDVCCDTAITNGDVQPALEINTTDLDCVSKLFNIVPPFKSLVFKWYIYKNGDYIDGFLSNDSLTYSFETAGEYLVVAYGNENCDTVFTEFCDLGSNFVICEHATTIVNIKISPNFEKIVGCTNAEVQFVNKSTYTVPVSSIEYLWDFGDTLSGNMNVSTLTNPTHIFTDPGTYTVKLTMSETSGCILSTTQSISIKDKPDVGIESKDVICIDQQANFRVVLNETDNFGLTYKWDFNDPGSSWNISNSFSAYHDFSRTGIFNVKLVVTNKNGCKTTIYKKVNVINAIISGEITSSIEMPKCPEDSVTLFAPSGNYSYLWSNGETTPKITISQTGRYKVTVTHNGGCEYVPYAFVVRNNSIINSYIKGKKYYSTGSYSTKNDSLTVCLGDSFDIDVTYIPNATYTWSNGYTVNNTLKFQEHFKNLPSGRYPISVIIKSSNGECTYAIKPFIVNILDSPPVPKIVGDNLKNCDSEAVELRIDSMYQGVTYKWSTGVKSDVISTTNAGNYYIVATSTSGCITRSDPYTIYPSPNTNEWLTGCIEVCLPRQFCINLNPINTYQLLKDETLIDTIYAVSGLVEFDKPGKYKVNIINQFGCSSQSDALDLAAKPNIHTISGIVYFDKNKNNQFDDTLDVLLEGVKVEAIKDGIVYHSTFTNISGEYAFDSLRHKDMSIRIDHSEIDYTLKGSTEGSPVFDRCVQSKEIDFPLRSDCKVRDFYRFANACFGSFVEFDGVAYPANSKDTLIVSLNKNCDSLVYIEVKQRERPNIDLLTSYSCETIMGGKLLINNNKDEILNYSIDNGPKTLDTLYSGIPSGIHLLTVQNNYGCIEEFNFEIDTLKTPVTEIITDKSCKGQEEGKAVIQNINGSDILFSLDTPDGYSSQTSFDSLAIGDHVIYILDSLGCVHEEVFEILTHDIPNISYEKNNTCLNAITGNLVINPIEDVLFYVDDQVGFDSILWYENLSEGQHMIYFKSYLGCVDSLPFLIEYFQEPAVSLDVTNTCKNEELGSFVINYDKKDSLLFRVSEVDQFSDSISFSSLPFGLHLLEILDLNGCIYQEEIEIDTFLSPIFTLESTNACDDQENGSILILSADVLTYSVSISSESYHSNDTIRQLYKGDYIVFMEDDNGCKDTLEIEISEYALPIVDLEVKAACENNNLGSLSIKGDSINQYSIDGNIYLIDNELKDLPAGQHTLFLKSIEGCIYEKYFEIPLLSQPKVELDIAPSCQDFNNGVLNLLGSDTSILYSLDSLVFSKVDYLDQLSIGSHRLFVQNELGCIYDFLFEIDSLPMPEAEITSAMSCPNDQTGSIFIDTDQTNTVSLDKSLYEHLFTFYELSEGNYQIDIRDTFGCTLSLIHPVDELAEMEVVFPPLEWDCYTEDVLLQPSIIYANGPVDYSWNTGSVDTFIVVEHGGNYAVQVSDSCQEATYEWEVEIQKIEDNKILHAPNIFTPFRGTENSCFKVTPPKNSIIADFKLEIFDRWGNQVFISKDYLDCWDGTLNGQKVEQGVYVYIAEITLLQCDTIREKKVAGDITVIH